VLEDIHFLEYTTNMDPTGKQIRAARKLLGYSADALAQRVGGINSHQIYRLERKQPRSLTVKLCAALEAEGIRFIGHDGVLLQSNNNGQRS
jgi:hypothetical protein